jgi:hypothetical protein
MTQGHFKKGPNKSNNCRRFWDALNNKRIERQRQPYLSTFIRNY